MSSYFIGDIHGCYDELSQLLDTINYDSNQDKLLFTGDLVGRGPAPLKVMQLVRQLQQENPANQCVLGNHDLHLISVAHGGYELGKNPDPTLLQVIHSAKSSEMLDWMIKLPLIYRYKDEQEDYVLVHAGIPHMWSLKQAMELANDASRVILETYAKQIGPKQDGDRKIPAWRSTELAELMHSLYGDKPRHLNDATSHTERLRVIVNSFTRMRMCNRDGSMELAYNGTPAKGPVGYAPWFSHWPKDSDDLGDRPKLIVFGHWAALEGVTDRDDIWSLDYGCAWGKQLAAKRLEDKQLFLIDAR